MASAALLHLFQQRRQLDRQRRRRQAVGAAGQQRRPQRLFQRQQASADGRVLDVQRPGRRPTASRPGSAARKYRSWSQLDVLRPGHRAHPRPSGAHRPRASRAQPWALLANRRQQRRRAPWRCLQDANGREREAINMYVVAGVSGHTGAVVADALLAAGKPVRVLVRQPGEGGTLAPARGARWRSRRWTIPRALAAALRAPAAPTCCRPRIRASRRSDRRRLAHRRRHRPGGGGQRPRPSGAAVGDLRGRRARPQGWPAPCGPPRPGWRRRRRR